MGIVLKSNVKSTNNLGNSNGLGDLQDFSFFIDFEKGETTLKENGAVSGKKTIDQSISLTRNTAGEYYLNGEYKTAGINVPRISQVKSGKVGLLIEAARTNLLLNPTAPVTQTVTINNTGNAAIVLSVYGSGSASISGNVTVSGSGIATEGNPAAAKMTGTGTYNVTITITGSLDRFQLERCSDAQGGAYATTFVSGTRGGDFVKLSSELTSKLSNNITVLINYSRYPLITDLLESKNIFGLADKAQPRGGVYVVTQIGSTRTTAALYSKNQTSVAENVIIGMSNTILDNTVVMTRDNVITQLSHNGTIKNSTVSVDIGNPNELTIGSRDSNFNYDGQIGGVIRKIVVYNRKLTNEELIKASTLFLEI